ncbi:MAG TPA: hypothetical protein DCL13_06200 [Peptococcaceae bacterium]|nr:hypothetical protein [Peptococcaceae bacterium]
MRNVLTLLVVFLLLAPATAWAQFRDELPAPVQDEPGVGGYCATFVVGEKRYWHAVCGGYPREYGMDVAPFIESDRTFVPVRFLAYAIGVPENGVSWDGATRTVRLENRGVAVILRLRETVLRRNGSPVQMDVAPVLRQNRVFLPARFVAEAFGYRVQWQQATKTVRVAPPAVIPEPEPQQPAGQKPPPQDPGINGGGIDLSKL